MHHDMGDKPDTSRLESELSDEARQRIWQRVQANMPVPLTQQQQEYIQSQQDRATRRTAWLLCFVLDWAALLLLLVVYAVTNSGGALVALFVAALFMLCIVTYHPGHKSFDKPKDKKAPRQ